MPGWITALLGALGGIGKIIALGQSLRAFVRANSSEKWFQSISQWIDKDLWEAQSEEDYRKAARNLKRLLRH